MLDAVANPRHAPRVRVGLTVDVRCNRDVWQSVTRDFGPGGCALVSYRSMNADARVQLLVRSSKLKDSLLVDGRVAWAADRKAGIAFVPEAGAGDPAAWFDRLLAATPRLRDSVRPLPPSIAGEEVLVRCPPEVWRDVDLSTNELLLLARVDEGASVAALAARTQLADVAFARAVYALLEKRVVERKAAQLPN